MIIVSVADARRIALAAQGFDRPRPARVDARQIRRVIHRLGLLQVDYVNVLVPAHYLVLFSRLGPYDVKLLDDLVYTRREFTEQWAREASIVPMEHWPMLRHRMDARDRKYRALTSVSDTHGAYARKVLRQVRRMGPVTREDVPEPAGAPAGRDFWGWTFSKAVLEAYFMRGVFAIAGRRADFARVYDLTERVVPGVHRTRTLNRDEAQRELVAIAARALGIATIGDVADYYRLPHTETQAHLRHLAERGEVREVKVEGWREPAYLHRSAPRPSVIEASALVSPFDPVVWHRPRVQRLFGFDYKLEIWVPAAARQWGYYVLPFLYGDRLIARVDLRADRAARRLSVLAAYAEPACGGDGVARALAGELQSIARWLRLDAVAVERRGNLAGRLRLAISTHPGSVH